MWRAMKLAALRALRFPLSGAGRLGLTAVFAVAALFVSVASSARAESQTSAADVIVTHGKVYTVNPAQPWAEAVAIKDGTIVAVGTSSELLKLRGPGTKVIDAQGHLVLPGFG